MAVGTFPLVPRRRAVGLAFGGARSARRGGGSDVAGSRRYLPGDDVAWIDWAASAKLSSARGADEFVVRERFADEAPEVVVLCDRRPSLGLGGSPLRPFDKPAALRGILALIDASARRARSRCGYLDHAEGVPYWLPPRGGDRAPERPFRAPEDSVSRGLEYLGERRRELPARSFVFVVSDFLAAPEERVWLRALEHRWEMVPVAVQDPRWERSFPDVGGLVVPFAEPRTGAVVPVRLRRGEARALREEHETRWAGRLHFFRALGTEPVVVDGHGERALLAAFLRWADLRVLERPGTG